MTKIRLYYTRKGGAELEYLFKIGFYFLIYIDSSIIRTETFLVEVTWKMYSI